MTTPAPLPTDLRGRVLAASRSARSGGRAVPVAPSISAEEAFARAADAFTGLLAVLDPGQWRQRVLRELDVQALVGHLTGVERDVQRALARDPEVADADHIASTQPLADAQAGRDPAATRAEWRAAVDATLELLATTRFDAGAVLSMHGMRLPVEALLIVRAFELWTHDNDIRRVVGLPPSVPDPSTLTLMTGLAVRLVPHSVERTAALSTGFDLHLVLTGVGGGTWDLPLGPRDSDGETAADLLMVVDAVDFCRLASNRIAPESLDVHVDGDATGASAILAGVASLALD